MAAHFVSNKTVEKASKAKRFLRSSQTPADKGVHVQTRVCSEVNYNSLMLNEVLSEV